MLELGPQPIYQFFDDSGAPLYGGKLYTYEAGTTIPAVTYSDFSGTTPNTNPIILDGGGRASVWLSPDEQYKFVLKDANDVLIWSVDDISNDAISDIISGDSGSDVVGFIQSGTGAQATTVEKQLRKIVYLSDFIPDGTDTTLVDCVPFVNNAITELKARGGGVFIIEPKQYKLISTTSDGYLNAHISVGELNNVHIIANGALFVSTYSSASTYGACFSFNIGGNLKIEGLEVLGNFSQTGGVVSEYSVKGLSFRSTLADLKGVIIENCKFTSCHGGVSVFRSSLADVGKVNNLKIDNVIVSNSYEAFLFNFNGFVISGDGNAVYNSVFGYIARGVIGHKFGYTYNDYSTNAGNACYIEGGAYDCGDLDLSLSCNNIINSQPSMYIISNHDASILPIPKVINNVSVRMFHNNVTSSDSVVFNYSNPTPQTSTANNLFDNFTFSGGVSGRVLFQVELFGVYPLIDLSGFDRGVGGLAPYDPIVRTSFQERLSAIEARYYTPLFCDTVVSVNPKTPVISNPSYQLRTLEQVRFTEPIVRESFTTTITGADSTRAYSILSGGITNEFGNNGENYYFFTCNNDSGGPKASGILISAISIFNNSSTGGYSVSAATMWINRETSTGRSINAAGTINASGSDYAELEYCGDIVFEKGDVVGFQSDGSLTQYFSSACRFGVKSTDPGYVGGDGKCFVGDVPNRNDFENDEVYDLELKRLQSEASVLYSRCDRIAYCGKVPVNVYGCVPGGYIIAAAGENDSIIGLFRQDVTFEEYKKCVGRVNRILDDGRAEIAVIIH